MSWEAGKPVVTFPIPGVPGATATATLDAKFMTERVVVKQGSTTTEFTYGDYQDWNNPLNKIEVLYAGKMAERRNGAVVRDLTTDADGDGQRLCGCARPGKRAGGHQGHRATPARRDRQDGTCTSTNRRPRRGWARIRT